jgi:hypothetical protein
MKKSFLYAAPAALILALLFTGCPQDSDDDDDDGGGPIPSYQRDVEGIAVAFADNAPVVYLKDNLHLGDYELVVPEGKTLDLSTYNVTIDRIESGGKIIVIGTIEFGTKSNILLYKTPDAKFIATPEYIKNNVAVVTAVDEKGDAISFEEGTESGHIKAFEGQVIEIAEFDVASADAWKAYLAENNNDYIPVKLNVSVIDDTIADIIGTYGAGRRLYLIGDVTITGQIDLTGPRYTPSSSVGQVYNVIPDEDGSLLIAGAVVFQDLGQVDTAGTLTILGTLTTKGDRLTAKVNGKGGLVAYLLRLDSGGGGFGGAVQLIGYLPSKLGGGAFFDSTLKVRGSIIIDEVRFKDNVIFDGPVEFIGDKDSIGFPASPKKIALNGPVTASNSEPVDITNTTYFDFGDNAVYSYDIEYGTSGSVTFKRPVTFNRPAKFESDANGKEANFQAGVTFNSSVVFDKNFTVLIGTTATLNSEPYNSAKAAFAQKITFGSGSAQLAGGSINIPVTFNSDATFKSPVEFKKSLTVEGNLTLDSTGTFGALANLNNDAYFSAGNHVVLSSGGTLSYKGGAIVITPITANGYLLPDPGLKVYTTLSDGKLTVPKTGTLTIGSAAIDISGNGEIVIETDPNTGIVFGSEGIAAQADKVYITSSTYKIYAGTSAGGTLVGLFGTITTAKAAQSLTLSNTGFSGDGSGSQAVLRLAGSYTSTEDGKAGGPNIEVYKDITIDGVTIDLAGSATTPYTNGSLSIANDKSPVITLKGGNTITTTDWQVSGAAGAIRAGGTILVLGAQVPPSGVLASTTVNDAFIVAKDGYLVAGTAGKGTISAVEGEVGSLGIGQTDGAKNVITKDARGSIIYGVPVKDAATAVGIVTSDNPKRYVPANAEATGGSIAVFAGTLAQ